MSTRDCVKILTGFTEGELDDLGGFADDPVYEVSGLDEFHPDTTFNGPWKAAGGV